MAVRITPEEEAKLPADIRETLARMKGIQAKPIPTVQPKRHKMNAVPTMYDGIRYDSKGEAGHSALLAAQKRAGEIRFYIIKPGRVMLGVPENVYAPDWFVIARNFDFYYVDYKGMRTPKFNRDVKLWRKYGPCPLHIVSSKNVEIIIPENPGTPLI